LRQQNKTFIVITGAEKQLMKTLFSSSSLHSTTLLYKKNLRVHFFLCLHHIISSVYIISCTCNLESSGMFLSLWKCSVSCKKQCNLHLMKCCLQRAWLFNLIITLLPKLKHFFFFVFWLSLLSLCLLA